MESLNPISTAKILSDLCRQIDHLSRKLDGICDLPPKSNENLLTRKETAQYLKIDLSTLHRWTKKGKLKSYGLGGLVYYKKSEIEDSLTEF